MTPLTERITIEPMTDADGPAVSCRTTPGFPPSFEPMNLVVYWIPGSETIFTDRDSFVAAISSRTTPEVA